MTPRELRAEWYVISRAMKQLTDNIQYKINSGIAIERADIGILRGYIVDLQAMEDEAETRGMDVTRDFYDYYNILDCLGVAALLVERYEWMLHGRRR